MWLRGVACSLVHCGSCGSLESLSTLPFFTCISIWISHLARFCPAIAKAAFIHQPIKSNTYSQGREGHPTSVVPSHRDSTLLNILSSSEIRNILAIVIITTSTPGYTSTRA